MEKQPFTPAGVAAVQQWLSSLPDAELNAEVLKMETGFEQWVLAHFELNEAQHHFFDKMSHTAQKNLKYLVILAVQYRRSVTLTQQYVKSNVESDEPDADKLFKPKSSLAVTSNNDGDYEVGGSLEIEVTYLT